LELRLKSGRITGQNTLFKFEAQLQEEKEFDIYLGYLGLPMSGARRS
jgi:hypothetical protein